MFSLGEILLISTLCISLSNGSLAKENPEINKTESIPEDMKTMKNHSISWQNDVILSSNEYTNTYNLKASNSSLLNESNIHEVTDSSSKLVTSNFTDSPRPTPVFSTSSPLIHGFVSRLPWNSSLADKTLLTVSTHPTATSVASSENFSWSLDNNTVKTPDNSSATVNILPPAPTTNSVTSLTRESTELPNTDNESYAGFTPYPEETTLQPTIKFTNNSKHFPNTSDSQKENRNTGVVFGTILGAILGVSLLSLVGYLLCGKRKTDLFSHRRLYDDRNEPVLRLDNAPEPYDVSFGNSSYYNPTVNDSSVPQIREHARDGIPMEDIPALRTSIPN
ncbi:mucin-15 [Ochotona princeps]|uniref:mucin-15 n=1 Tax=Ochotona princeps TaxID=9978 RepID=UPI0027153AF4|nr:mucin-15 [Ochotona princeps]